MKLAHLTSSSLLVVSCCLVGFFGPACSGSPGAPGSAGKSGAPGTPGADAVASSDAAISLVEPRVGLPGRRLEVTIITDGHVDLTGAKVDFGPGIKVAQTAPQGSALRATVEIAQSAELGKHDVVVTTTGGKTLTAKNAFVVAVHLDAKVSGGKAEQGGLVRIDITNRDNIWFDTENFALFPLVLQNTPSLVGVRNEGFTATDGSVIFLGDPLAKTGTLGFLGFNDPNDDQSPSFATATDAVNVSARQPVELVSGTSVDKAFESELETGFYVADFKPTGKEGLLVEAWAKAPPDSTMAPMILAYPNSGSAAELLDQQISDPGFPMFGLPATEARVAYPVTVASKGYFIVTDSDLAHGPATKMTLSYSAVRAQVFAEKPDAHGTGDTAQNIGSLPGTTTAVPGRLVTGELKTAGEVDVYKFTGLSQTNPTDVLVSVVSDSDVVVQVDTVDTFDSDELVTISQGGKAGMGVTAGFVGKDRFIQITSAPDGGKPTGKYTLGIKRIAQAGAPN